MTATILDSGAEADEARAKAPPHAGGIADWTAGYEAGWTAGYHAARTALDDAAHQLATTLRPSEALDVRERRAAESTSAWRTPAERDAYRARVCASWGLAPPTNGDPDRTEEEARSVEEQAL